MQLGHTIYIHHTAEAVPFYCRVFGLELGYHVKMPTAASSTGS